MKITTDRIELPHQIKHEIIDTATDTLMIYILDEKHIVFVLDHNGDVVDKFSLHQDEINPTMIYTDDKAVYIGFENGTVEIRKKIDRFEHIKTTSDKDPGGPGKSWVVDIYSTQNYVLINTKENGLLIYFKDDYMFYKWIMVDGYTTITDFAIFDELLYVLTHDHYIHVLDFEQSRLIPLQFNIHTYSGLDFDGNYLYLSTQDSVNIFDTQEGFSPVNGYSIKGAEIMGIASFQSLLLLLLSNLEVKVLDTGKFEIVESFVIPSKKLFTKLKYNFVTSNNSHDKYYAIKRDKLIEILNITEISY